MPVSRKINTKLVRVGSGYGVIIPEEMIERQGLTGEIKATVEEGYLDIRPAREVREGSVEAR